MSKLRGWFVVLSCVFVLLFSLPGFAGYGGTLRFVQSSTGEEDFLWPVSLFSFSKTYHASMVLDRDKSESVSVFLGLGPVPFKIFITTDEPQRLFIDLNGDDACQPGEMHPSTISNFYLKTFKNVTVPTRIGEATTTIACDFSYTTYNETLMLTGIRSYFAGPIELNGESWPARVVLRSAFTEQSLNDAIILLDTNRDGVFDLLEDTCIATQGLARIDGDWWQSTTRFEGATAKVSLAPYQGPMGELEIKGESVYWVELQKEKEETNSKTAQQQSLFYEYDPDSPETSGVVFDPKSGVASHPICLKPGGETRFDWPTGLYRTKRVVLREDDLYLQNELGGSLPQVAILEGASSALQIGGPLNVKVIASPPAFSRMFSFEFKGCRNERGIEFQPLGGDLARNGETQSRPEFEVVNARGKVIASGHFDYG